MSERDWPEIPFHPLANLFPFIDGSEFDELVASIKSSGQREPIVMFEEMILDGRNRYRACLKGGVSPRFVPFVGGDPVKFVIDVNLHRRHLNASQRGLIAAQLSNLRKGGLGGFVVDAENSTSPISMKVAAKIVGVCRDTILDAKTVLEQASPSEVEAAKNGEIAVSTLADQIRRGTSHVERNKLRKIPVVTKGDNPERFEKMRMRAQIWANLRDALNCLSALPKPAEVLAIAIASDRTGLVKGQLDQSLFWLEEFYNAWNAQQGTRDNNSDAGKSDRAA